MKKRIDTGFAFHRVCFVLGLLWLVATWVPVSRAQSPPAKAAPAVSDDRTPIRVRYPETEHLHDLQTDHDYQYGRDAPPPENPVARFFSWLFGKLGQFLRSKAYENVWQYVILAAVAGFAIYLLARAEVLGFLFPKKAQATGMDYENLAEDIQEIDFNAAIDEAIAVRNFRLTVRLLYLQTLKQLTNAGHIGYKPDKTNRQYVQELANTALQADFEKLTRWFEFVWYGDFPVDDSQFTTIRNEFRQFGVSAESMGKPHSYSN
ncbi:DUF4129 domain-containing protein [Spirosoma spitsbergense]|uniref:DUF4129 domain-containing protein n=1 Tax=Spirosoma spitsbergense TaxID=431554 RepID=UPI000373BD59|nr:DUF4129 domain-containing protein [Spirosoma spitsbergense]